MSQNMDIYIHLDALKAFNHTVMSYFKNMVI